MWVKCEGHLLNMGMTTEVSISGNRIHFHDVEGRYYYSADFETEEVAHRELARIEKIVTKGGEK